MSEAGRAYALSLFLSVVVAALVAYFACTGPDVEIRQLPEIQPLELRD